jgi:hypothetical protein
MYNHEELGCMEPTNEPAFDTSPQESLSLLAAGSPPRCHELADVQETNPVDQHTSGGHNERNQQRSPERIVVTNAQMSSDCEVHSCEMAGADSEFSDCEDIAAETNDHETILGLAQALHEEAHQPPPKRSHVSRIAKGSGGASSEDKAKALHIRH